MASELNKALFRPLLKCLAGPHFKALKQSHTPILIAELALLPIEQLYTRSLLAHEARLTFKPSHNPAARLHAAIQASPTEHDTCADIRERMEQLSLTTSMMASAFWTDHLTTQLTKQAKHIAHSNQLRSHNIDQSRQLHTHTNDHKPFYRRFLNAKHVLKLRLQMAPLATMMYDDDTALCQRCYQAADTIQHWMWQCGALATPRLTLILRINAWAQLYDNSLNSRQHSPHTNTWNTYSQPTRDLALQGTITNEMHRTLTMNPAPMYDPALPHVTHLSDEALISKRVHVLNTYAKLTENTCSLALHGPSRSFAF